MSQTVVRQRLGPTANPGRRTWDDRLRAPLPARLVRAGTAWAFRLSPHSRLRKALVARAVKRSWAAAQREDWKLLRPFYADDVEFSVETADGEPLVGMTEGFRGFDGIVAVFDEMLPTLDDVEYRIVELLDAGDWLIALMVIDARGRTSGVETSMEMANVYDVRDGLIVRQRGYYSWAAGLDAVGLAHIADELDRERREAPSRTPR